MTKPSKLVVRIGVLLLLVYCIFLKTFPSDLDRQLEPFSPDGPSSHHPAVLYIHIPQSGGPILEQAFQHPNSTNSFSSLTDLQHHHHNHNNNNTTAAGAVTAGSLVVTMCRDPCDRFAAVWQGRPDGAPGIHESGSVNEYVQFLEDHHLWHPLQQQLPAFRAAHTALVEPQTKEWGVDIVLCYEQWDDEVETLLRGNLGPRLNRPNEEDGKKDDRLVCSQETREIFKRRYAMDYCLFGYSPERYNVSQPTQCIGTYMSRSNFTDRYRYCEAVTAHETIQPLEETDRKDHDDDNSEVVDVRDQLVIAEVKNPSEVVVVEVSSNATEDDSIITLQDEVDNRGNNNDSSSSNNDNSNSSSEIISLEPDSASPAPLFPEITASGGDSWNATTTSVSDSVVVSDKTKIEIELANTSRRIDHKLSAHQLWSLSHPATQSTNWTAADGHLISISEQPIRYGATSSTTATAASFSEGDSRAHAVSRGASEGEEGEVSITTIQEDRAEGEELIINWEDDPELEKLLNATSAGAVEQGAGFDASLVNWEDDENWRSVLATAAHRKKTNKDRVIRRPKRREKPTGAPTRAPNYVSNARRETERRDAKLEEVRNSPEYISRLNSNTTVAT